MNLRKVNFCGFLAVMCWSFWKFLMLGIEMLKIQKVTDALTLLNIKGIFVVDFFSKILDSTQTFGGIVSAFLNSISVIVLILIICCIISFKKTQLWKYFCIIVGIYVVLNVMIVILFSWVLTLTNPELGLWVAHISAWVIVLLSGLMTLLGIVGLVAVLSDLVAIEG